MYQQPRLFQDLLENNEALKSQADAGLLMPIVSPEKIQNDVCEIAHCSSNFNHEKIKTLFDTLENKMIKYGKPFSMVLANYNHAISVGYIPNKGWYLIDANQLPSKKFQSTTALGEAVLAAFKTSGNMMIAAKIYGYKSVMEKFNDELKNDENWKNITLIGPQVADLDDNHNSLLLIETLWGNLDPVNKLIQAGANVNQVNKDGDTPLVKSVAYIELLQTLIDAKGDINHVNNVGNTALIEALKKSAIPSTKLLIDNGANVNQINKKGETPLILAIKIENIEIIQKLIECRADINQVDKAKKSPLIYAVEIGSIEIIKKLLEAHADINHVDETKKSPLIYAVENGNVEMIKILLNEGADPNQSSETTTALLTAIASQNIDLVNLLIINHANVNQTPENALSPLMLAVLKKNKEIVDLLIFQKADINLMINNSSPLFLACESGNVVIIKTLIDAGVNVNQIDKFGKNALMLAIKFGNIDIVKMLISSKANINQVTSQGESPLLTAIQSNNIDMVKILLNAGANVNQQTSSGETPLLKAAEIGNIEAVKLMIQAKANISLKGKYEIKTLKSILDDKNINYYYLEDLIKEKNAVNVIELAPLEIAKIFNNKSAVTFLQQQIKSTASFDLDDFLQKYKKT